MGQRVSGWTSNNFSDFGRARKQNPVALTPEFKKSYYSVLDSRFADLKPSTQVEILTGELTHYDWVSSMPLKKMIRSTAASLALTEARVNILSVKQLYRGLLHTLATQPAQFTFDLADLRRAIEIRLADVGESLDAGGRIDPTGGSGEIDPQFEALEALISRQFPKATRASEYYNADYPGFYDPVDSYWEQGDASATFPLVVEWDGRHHYFIRMDARGELIGGTEGLVLRPVDQAKDRALRWSGVNVLRVHEFIEINADKTDIGLLVEQQNP